MTPEEHNKALGICHLAYGGLSALFMFVMLFMFGAIFLTIPEGPPAGFVMILLTFIMVWSLILTVPSFLAGYALLRHRTWARTASIVAAVLEVLSFPLGTAVAVYSFWFMFSDTGKSLYDQTHGRSPERPYALRDAPPPPPPYAQEWGARTSQEREREYVPPAQPPDWRNE